MERSKEERNDGLQFPVWKTAWNLRDKYPLSENYFQELPIANGSKFNRFLDPKAAVYLTGTLEYLISNLLDMAGARSGTITRNDLIAVVKQDRDLKRFPTSTAAKLCTTSADKYVR